jgi:hypothetical protein
MNRETRELEAERLRLDAQSGPTRWDRASWIRGAMYALAWVINRRGAEIAPLEAALAYVLTGEAEAPSYPTAIVCPGCGGVGAGEGMPCPACQGHGRIIDHGPPPDPNPGLVAIKPCGCAVDWLGDAAPKEYRRERIELWQAQHYRIEQMELSEAGPRITAGGACQHQPQRPISHYNANSSRTVGGPEGKAG